MQNESDTLLISEEIRIKNGHMVSISGPFQLVINHLLTHKDSYGRILVLGQNGHLLSDPDPKRQEGLRNLLRLHVFVANRSNRKQAVATLILKKFLLPDYDYAHAIGMIGPETVVYISGDSMLHNPHSVHILETLRGTLFANSVAGKLPETVLFIGRKKQRTLTFLDLELRRCKTTVDPFPSSVQGRHAIVGNMILSAVYKRAYVFAVNAKIVSEFILSAEILPAWQQITIGDQSIEEIGMIDGVSDKVIFTFGKGEFRYMPFLVRFRNTFELNAIPLEGLTCEQVGKKSPPVTRYSPQKKRIVQLCRDRGILELNRTGTLVETFSHMVTAVGSSQLSQ